MKRTIFLIVSLAMALTSLAQASEIDMQILACGTVQISTNSAQTGMMGATVMTTSIATAKNVFQLQAVTEEDYRLISTLVDGEKFTFLGIAKADLKADGSKHMKVNLSGSIDLYPRIIVPGCF